MTHLIIKSIINDKYYKYYNYLFNNTIDKFNLINNYILYNYFFNSNHEICGHFIKFTVEKQIYDNIIFYDNNKQKLLYNYNLALSYNELTYLNECNKIINNKHQLIITKSSKILLKVLIFGVSPNYMKLIFVSL
jgi:hypothetical protein